MPRYAKLITKNELSLLVNDKKNLLKIPYKDFNLEIHLDDINIDIEENNKLVFALISAKAHHETLPIYFIAYVDTKNRLRAFVPKHGNLYNPWTGTAFGSERAWKVKAKSITNMPKQYYEENIEQGGYKETQQYKDEFEHLQPNIEAMINEFTKFIHLVAI